MNQFLFCIPLRKLDTQYLVSESCRRPASPLSCSASCPASADPLPEILELEIKVMRRFAKISQSRRRPLLGRFQPEEGPSLCDYKSFPINRLQHYTGHQPCYLSCSVSRYPALTLLLAAVSRLQRAEVLGNRNC